ncbi:MAG TPA: acetylglutamate kinase [Nitrospiria bacterium]|nr:acetylglutamate kinase [Nitrospiria bacterium]
MEKAIKTADVLVEALPYIRAFAGKTIVVKYGGKAMVEASLKERFGEDIALMKYVGIRPVIVHGGGPQISDMMKRLGKEPTFVRGIRVTDAETVGIVEMVLGGVINPEIVALINRHGGRAVGLTGKDGPLLIARPMKTSGKKSEVDLGLVGEIDGVDPGVLQGLEEARYIPVIAPIAGGVDGRTYNVNADSATGAIAAALKAEKLLLLTDVPGILDAKGALIPTISKKETQQLIRRGTIASGMIPKVQACLDALDGGVAKAHIIDGRTPHALLLELFTDKGIGTEIIV